MVFGFSINDFQGGEFCERLAPQGFRGLVVILRDKLAGETDQGSWNR